jgi:hypothetical protein
MKFSVRSDRNVSFLKSFIITGVFVMLCMLAGAAYGRRNDAELMGVIFAAIIGVLIVVECFQILPHILNILFSVKKQYVVPDIDESVSVFVIEGNPAVSLCFSSFSHHYILLSAERAFFIDFELVRIRRGHGYVHTASLLGFGHILLVVEWIFIYLSKRSFLRYIVRLILPLYQLLLFPNVCLQLLFFFPRSRWFSTDILLSHGYKSIAPVQSMLSFFEATPGTMHWYTSMMPYTQVRSGAFKSVHHIFSLFVPSLHKRKTRLKHIVV